MSATDSLTYMTFDLLVNGHHRLITNRVQSVVQSIILIYTLRIALDLQYQALVVLVRPKQDNQKSGNQNP
jgi:hypothetical protein